MSRQHSTSSHSVDEEEQGAAAVSRRIETADSGSRVETLDGVRAISMLCVFAVHLYQNLDPYTVGSFARATSDLGKALGFIAVECFLLITGCFTYAGLLSKPEPTLSFLRRRLIRLYPVYLVILTIYLAVYTLLPGFSRLPSGALRAATEIGINLTMLAAFRDSQPINQVSWVLSYFLLFYVVIAVSVNGLGMRTWRPGRRVWYAAVLIGLSVVLNRLVSWWHPAAAMLGTGMILSEILAIHAVERLRKEYRLALFGAGALLLAAKLYLKWARPFRDVPGANINAELLCSAAFLMLFLALAVSAESWPRRILLWGPLRWMGAISYSFYLSHGISMKLLLVVLVPLLKPILPVPVVFWIVQPVMFGAALVVAAAIYRFVERPCTRWLREGSPAERMTHAARR